MTLRHCSSLCIRLIALEAGQFTGRALRDWVLKVASGAAIAAMSTCVLAHDTWFRLAPRQPGSGLLALQLGEGTRYPKNEGVIPGSRVIGAGCVDEQGRKSALLPRSEDGILELRSRLSNARAAACWLELPPVELQLTPELVKVYFDEIHASPAVREVWEAQQKSGVGWREVYRKFVRVELPVPGAAQRDPVSAGALRRAHGFPLELVPLGEAFVQTGVPAEYQALADGKPVAGLPVQFVSVRSPLGIWTQTDAQGRIRFSLPFGGEWLLRATALEPPSSAQAPWRSRFATLTVQVQ
ncbi:hypothetical protein GCM10027034_03540 [Ramlibacter solisilvae]|uniref:DUF4198 domain-containing protein n=1 Tax=Ramlibacter tataouinensis TaxID=94132 RepID=A0A127JNI8_9BURK|nr:DUF4198 domain-containing protein [Ramlibacter tataouinensis]AMO21568.1 hypothetical protein UC35_00135 [Ramlibacter tataouinensis]